MRRRWACWRHSTSALPLKRAFGAPPRSRLSWVKIFRGATSREGGLGVHYPYAEPLASGVLSLRADRATEVVASRHRLGGPHASAGPSRRAPSFRPARFQPALNCRARAVTPFYTCPGASHSTDSESAHCPLSLSGRPGARTVRCGGVVCPAPQCTVHFALHA